MTPDEVYSRFASALTRTPWPSSGRLRTAAVLTALGEVGEMLAPDGCDRYAEFMLDFCSIDRHSRDMLLAAESELSDAKVEPAVDDDFQKLVYVNAPLKIFIFQRVEPEAVLARAIDFLRAYPRHSTGDTYIFVHIDWTGKTSGWRLTTGQDGKMPESANAVPLSP